MGAKAARSITNPPPWSRPRPRKAAPQAVAPTLEVEVEVEVEVAAPYPSLATTPHASSGTMIS
jgi:hypothetical protein